ncbi:REDY-like protein HapK [Sphingorhabdus lutea]|uniref:REDY-like protein HapK n=1 Tax=Sphingorhabdus lutea TaxID=1913578 RepID=A0A1L3J958_9SPHN|nr:REDY-like protein HapK [Sphingorhabdus lutea]APG61650.1 REDY-like protein HapK [Sphingorhabdus lutea]
MRIIVLFNLKSGVNAQEYEAWARADDIPTANALPSVHEFTVHRATGIFGSDAKSPYDYIEVIDINGMDEFVGDVSNPEFQAKVAPFQAFADNPIFILTKDI